MKPICRFAGVFLGAIGLLGLLAAAILWSQQFRDLPRAPDLANGRIHPRNIHGVVVYQTAREQDALDLIQNTALASFGLSAILSAYYKGKWQA